MLSNEESKKCIEKVIDNLKAKGTFDELRRQCMADVDIKPSYRNLLQRVEGYVSKFLYQQHWSPKLNKNQLRNRLRNEINESDMLRNGIKHLIDQVVNEKIENQFKIKIEEALHEYLGITVEEEHQKNEHKPSDEKDEKENSESDSKDQIDRIKIEKSQPEKNHQDENNLNKNDESFAAIPVSKISENENSIVQEIKEENPDNITTINENEDNTTDIDMDIVWPTPPKPEMLTPEHIKDESMDSLHIDESYCMNANEEPKNDDDDDDDNNNDNDDDDDDNDDDDDDDGDDDGKNNHESLIIKSDEITIPSEDQLKNLDVAQADSNSELKEKDQEKIVISDSTTNNPEEEEDVKDEISDVSSVHTSDLSDFDDEISIEGSDSDEVTKKKISLKVVKELTASITESKAEEATSKQIPTIEQFDDDTNKKVSDEETIKQDTNKRKRRKNPKFMSSEYSYSDVKMKKTVVETTEHVDKDKEDEIKTMNVKRKRVYDVSSETTNKEPKLVKQNSKNNFVSSLKKSDCLNSSNNYKTNKRNIKQNRNDQSNKRYDSSDLYKPRHRLTSSRRGRSLVDPMTPESNSNSNDDNTDK